MTHEFSNLDYDPGFVGPNFRKEMNGMIKDAALDLASDTARTTAEYVKKNKNDFIVAGAITSSVLLSGSSPSQGGGSDFFTQIAQDAPTRNGAIFGIAFGLEEAFEKGHETVPQKAKAIAKKIIAGFGAGWSGTHFVDGNANAVDYVVAASSAISIIEETKAKDIITLFARKTGGKLVSKVGNVVGEIDYRNNLYRWSKLINEAKYNGNSQSQNETKEQSIRKLSEEGFGVYERNKKGEITGKNYKVLNAMFQMMGTDNLLQENEARNLYERFHQPANVGREDGD